MTLNQNWLEHLLGQEWELSPAGGATGEAYYARHGEQKLFLKRNSSPFLAVLSAEGIVPKLVWTRRMENGDVITAQHWLEGRELKPADMDGDHVASLLHKIHHSKELLDMLKRLEKQPLTPSSILEDIRDTLEFETYFLPEIEEALQYLHDRLPDVEIEEKVVCHCDLNHNNWLLADNDQLYLIDWDGAVIADPAIDLGNLLYSYIEESRWSDWLSQYGLELTDHLRLRMYWYVLAQTIVSLMWNRSKNHAKEMHQAVQNLTLLLTRKI
ncbi:phosphotransferase family protein [Metabacillus sp. FJAT-52054]|uniref:Phosphotransferase family protein n=1 Tax=Metabacillus sediminis TaxID=3117746 RepID=A0ABZ2NFE5_9BACI